MKKVLKWICVALVAMLVTVSTVFAADDPKSVTVPAEITIKETTYDGEEVETSRTETFVVELEAVTDGAPMPSGASGSSYKEEVNAPGSVEFNLEFDSIGVYNYTIHQTDTADLEKEGWTIDEAEYTMVVYVTYAEDGSTLETQVVFYLGTEKVDAVTFENTYVQAKPAKWDPPVQKKVEGDVDKIPDGTTYTFAMIPDDPEAPMPNNDECYTDGSGALYLDTPDPGSYEFGEMYFDESHVGKTYTYTLKEIKGEDSNFEYDPIIYTMTIVVTEENNEVKLDVTYSDPDGNEVDTMVFTNVYKAEESSTPEPPTGDTANPFLWGILLVVAAAGMVTAILVNKKKSGKEE